MKVKWIMRIWVLPVLFSCGLLFMNCGLDKPLCFYGWGEQFDRYAGVRVDIEDSFPRFVPQWTPDGADVVFAVEHWSSIDPFHEELPKPGIRIYVAASDGSSLVPINNYGSELHIDHSPSISPDGSRIAYSAYRHVGGDTTWGDYTRYFEIEMSKLDGSDRRTLTEGTGLAGFDISPVWSPDGSHIAFVRLGDPRCMGNPRPMEVYTMKADGSDVRKIVDKRPRYAGLTLKRTRMTYEGGLTWSTDGQSLAYVVREGVDHNHSGGRDAIVTVGADGSGLKRLFAFPARGTISHPAWSPNSQRIAFVGQDDQHDSVAKLYTVGRDGSDLRELVSPGVSASWPRGRPGSVSWSPDGSQIRFSLGWEGDGLYVVNIDGSGLRLISGEGYGAWSPDGSRIARVEPEGLGTVLYVMAPNGSDTRILVRRGDDGALEAVGPGHTADIASCSAGIVVPDPDANPDLVRDCEALLMMMDRVAVPGLNWNADTPIAEWEGVSLSGPRERESTSGPSEEPLSPPRIRELSLPERGMRGAITAELTELTELRTLDLSGNELTGPIPSGLSNLTDLRMLDFGGNNLDGPIPPGVGNLAGLEELNMSGIHHAGPFPSELWSLLQLRSLDLSGTGLSGPIPPELGNLFALEQLNLSYNDLSGPIPPELGELSQLRILTLNRTDLSGRIPSELGNLMKLELLNLSGTELEGPIPPELGNLSALEILDLGNIELEGPIPPELGGLPALKEMLIRWDNISGCVPLGLRYKIKWRPRELPDCAR